MGIVYSQQNNSALSKLFSDKEDGVSVTLQLNKVYWNKPFELDINFDFTIEDILSESDCIINNVTFYRYHQKSYVSLCFNPTLSFIDDFDDREEYYYSDEVEWYTYDEEKGSHTFGSMPLGVLLDPNFYSKVIPHQRLDDKDIDLIKEMCIDFSIEEDSSSESEEELK